MNISVRFFLTFNFHLPTLWTRKQEKARPRQENELREKQAKLDEELKKLDGQRKKINFVSNLFADVEKKLKELEASPDYASPKQTVTGSEAAKTVTCSCPVDEQQKQDGAINQGANPNISEHSHRPLGNAAGQGTPSRQ